MKKTYDIADVAELAGVARNTAYAVVARDDELLGVPALRVGRRILFARAAIDEALGITTTQESSDGTSTIE